VIGLFGRFFIVLALAEALLFWVLFDEIGFWQTAGLGALSCVTGLFLVQAQGVGLAAQMRAPFSQELTLESLLGSLSLLLAGFLFAFPGFVSDALGFALLVPTVRAFIKQKTVKPFAGQAAPRYPAGDDVIEGDFEVVPDVPEPIEHRQKER
jgi:UPF0716 protein FxsA